MNPFDAELSTLGPAELPSYLLERGLLDREAVVDGDLKIAEASRRNRNFKVLRDHGPSLFVKQARDRRGDALATLRREAVFYETVTRDPACESLRAFLPTYLGFDDRSHLLVLELTTGEHSAATTQGWTGPPPQVVHATGRTLGRFHRTAAGLTEVFTRDTFPGRLPWVFTVHQTPDGWMPTTSAGQVEWLAQIRADPRARAALDIAARFWRPSRQPHLAHLIHGDLKWDNVLVANTDGELPRIRLVDWELTDLGDPAWDVGALVQSALQLQAVAGPSHGDTLWAYTRSTAQTLLAGYLSEHPQEAGDHQDLLQRTVVLGGARAVQSAFEMLFAEPQITPQAQTVLQVGLQMIEDPNTWSQALFH